MSAEQTEKALGEILTEEEHFQVVIDRGPTSWGAVVPELPGVGAVSESLTEVLRLIREAIVVHVCGPGELERQCEAHGSAQVPIRWRFKE